MYTKVLHDYVCDIKINEAQIFLAQFIILHKFFLIFFVSGNNNNNKLLVKIVMIA